MRADLAAHLATELAGAGHSVSVYDHKPDVVDVPAVVIDRGEIRPYTKGGPGFLEWQCDVVLVVRRADPASAEDLIEDLFMDTAVALTGYRATGNGMARWSSFGRMEQLEVNGIPCLAGALEVTVVPSS